MSRIYKILGACDEFEDAWFEGGHCGSTTVVNAVRWSRRWFG